MKYQQSNWMEKLLHFTFRSFIFHSFQILNLISSGHWCEPCRTFTPKLAEAFNSLSNTIKQKLDIVFISCDQDQSEFDRYYREMPWKALPFSGN